MSKVFKLNIKNKQVVILVGGYGKRLGKLTKNISKPMIDIKGKPFLEYLINYLKDQGFKKILLLAGYKGYQLKKKIRKIFKKDGIRIEFYIEKKPMGTGYALKKAKNKLENKFFLINGDTFSNLNFKGFLKSVNSDKLINLCVTNKKNTQSGNFFLTNKKIFFREKPSKSSGLINCGIYFLKKEIIKHITIKKNSFEKNLIPRMIAIEQISLIKKKVQIIDIGTIKGMKDFTKYTLN